MISYYFGCWRRVGHHSYLPGMGSASYKQVHWYPDTPWKEKIDGTLTPGKRDGSGYLSYQAMSKLHQSEAALHHKDGWTALAIHDFTVDSRPNSNSVFFFDEELPFFDACSYAEEIFPEVFKRITSNGEHPISLIETHDG